MLYMCQKLKHTSLKDKESLKYPKISSEVIL